MGGFERNDGGAADNLEVKTAKSKRTRCDSRFRF